MEISPGQQHQMQNRALTTEQMIAELHRCLVLGESLATAQSSLQNATSNERECVVSHGYWSPPDDFLLTLDPHAQLATTATRLIQHPQDLESALTRHADYNASASFAPSSWPGDDDLGCRCPKFGRRSKQRSLRLGPFKYLSSVNQRHSASCPLSSGSVSERSQSLAFPTLPFLAGTVELLSSFYAGQRLAGFSIKYHPTVQRYSSPAFIAVATILDHAGIAWLSNDIFSERERLNVYPRRWEPDELQLALRNLPTKLERIFLSGEALPNAKDERGSTLLLVSLPSDLMLSL